MRHPDSRVMGCTQAELERWLSELTGAPVALDASGGARVALPGGGMLTMASEVLPPRRIALLALPQTQVDFTYDDAHRAAAGDWLARFDFHTQRGGG